MSDYSQARQRTQDWLKKNPLEVSESKVWPPSSPDYSLSDYFVCGFSDLQVNAKPQNKIEGLIQKMKAVTGSLDMDTVAKAFQRLRSRIKDVVTANSHFIE